MANGKKATSSEVEVIPIRSYAVMQSNPEELRQVMHANLGDRGISEFELDRIRVPSGGALSWSVPSLSGEVEEKAVEGVIVAWKDIRVYWKQAFDETGGGNPPDCSSEDCVTGVGTPGGSCKACPLAIYGTSDRGSGQACHEKRALFTLRQGDLIPVVIMCPPGSLRPVRNYFLRLSTRAMHYSGVISRFELEKDKSKSGFTYSKIVPSLVSQLSPEERERVRKYAEGIAPALARVSVTQADVSEPAP